MSSQSSRSTADGIKDNWIKAVNSFWQMSGADSCHKGIWFSDEWKWNFYESILQRLQEMALRSLSSPAWADIPLLNPPSWGTGKLAVEEELALQRWVADGWVGSHCTWYRGELLKSGQLHSIWPRVSPCEQRPTLHEECGPLDRASALQPGVQVLLLVQRYTMLKWLNHQACFVFQF